MPRGPSPQVSSSLCPISRHNPAEPLCVFIKFVRNAPLAGPEALKMFQYEILNINMSLP